MFTGLFPVPSPWRVTPSGALLRELLAANKTNTHPQGEILHATQDVSINTADWLWANGMC